MPSANSSSTTAASNVESKIQLLISAKGDDIVNIAIEHATDLCQRMGITISEKSNDFMNAVRRLAEHFDRVQHAHPDKTIDTLKRMRPREAFPDENALASYEADMRFNKDVRMKEVANTNKHTCRKCGSKNIKETEFLNRSSDEPLDSIYRCLKCGATEQRRF